MSSNSYHSCAVRECKNTSIKTPGKLWIKVPSVDTNMRKIWLNLARRDPNLLSPKSPLYFCEDHFDLENDMENYMQYKIMGSVRTIRMKPKCVPSKFDCQLNPKPKKSKPRRTYVKRQQMSNIQEINNQDLRDIHNIVNKADKGVQVIPVQEHKAVQINVKLPNDMDNYMEYHVMGSVSQVRMKPGCIPTKFKCQSEKKKQKFYVLTKQSKILSAECENDLKEIGLATKHEDFGKLSFESSALNAKMDNTTQEETCKTLEKKNETKTILMHITDKLRSNANQTKMTVENQMATLQPKLSVSTLSLKIKKCVTPEPLQRTPSRITLSGVISKAASAGLSESSDADSNGARKPGTSSKKKNHDPKQSSCRGKEIKVFCPKCNAEVSHTAEGIQEDQTKALIAKVFHYFEEELELLKKMTAKLKLLHLSKFRYRTAQATGVSEAAVLEILQEEARRKAAKRYEQPQNAVIQQEVAKNAEIYQEPPEKRHRSFKNPIETESSNEDTNDSANDVTQPSVLQQIKIEPENEERFVKEEPMEYYDVEPEIIIEPSNVKGLNNEQAQIDPIWTEVKVEPSNDEMDERHIEEESSIAEAPSYYQLSEEPHVVKTKKKERQQRYREKNREKLKQREAERRKRIQCLQNIAEPSSSNINRIELNDEEVIDADSENSTQATQDVGDIKIEINYDPSTSNSSPNIPVRVDNRNAERNRLYRKRHREIINQRRRDNWQRKRELEQIHSIKQNDNEIEEISPAISSNQLSSNTYTQRQQQYYERDGEEINKCQTDIRLPQNLLQPIAASNAERNRSYRERNRQRINEQRRLNRRQRIHTESNRSSLLEVGQVKVEKIDIEDDGFS